MGTGNRISCSNCDYSDDLMIGGGIGPWFREPCIDTLVIVLDDHEKRRLLNLQENHMGKLIGYPCNDYCYCPKCNTLHSSFFYKIEYDNGKIYSSKNECPSCMTSLVNIPDEVEVEYSDYNCPKCGNKTLVDGGISIMWD